MPMSARGRTLACNREKFGKSDSALPGSLSPVMPAPRPYPDRFKVAFSFSGKQRQRVEEIATEVEKRLGWGTVFYDQWFEAAIAGMDGYGELVGIYGERADMVIVCVSAEYGSSEWPSVEFEEICGLHLKLRAAGERKDRLRILPVRMGPGEVRGIPVSAISPEFVNRSIAQCADVIEARYWQWENYKPPQTKATATVLMTPPVAALSAVAEQMEDWLEEQNIAVVRIDPTLDEAALAAAISAGVEKAAAVVDWVQEPTGEVDTAFAKAAARVISLAGKKPVLRWMNPELPARPEDCQDPRVRRLSLEAFKKEVLREVRQPPVLAGEFDGRGRLVIVASQADKEAFDELLKSLGKRARDAKLDEAHFPPSYGETPDWDDEISAAVRHKSVGAALFIYGACRRAWIDKWLRVYDFHREGLPKIPLIVWDKPLSEEKETRRFLLEYEIDVPASHAAELLPEIP